MSTIDEQAELAAFHEWRDSIWDGGDCGYDAWIHCKRIAAAREAELLAQLDFLGAKEHANQLRAADAEIARLRVQLQTSAEPACWRAYKASHWNDGPPDQASIDYYGANLQVAYARPPAVVPGVCLQESQEYDQGWTDGWNACRDAMLAAIPDDPAAPVLVETYR